MARKSRKNTQTLNFTTNKKTYSAGIYVTLSRFDNEKDILKVEKNKNLTWKNDTFKEILKNEVYICNMIQKKQRY